MPPKPLPKYVKAVPDSKGTIRLYLRYRGKYQRLPDDPQSQAFWARYSSLVAGIKAPIPIAAGSVAYVITDYKSTEHFQQLAPKTRSEYSRYLEHYEPVRHLAVDAIKRVHVMELQRQLSKHPRAAEFFARVSSVLFQHAIALGLIETNPASDIKRVGKAEPYRAWSDEECARFEVSNPPQAMLTAYMLGRYTGQRRGDILRWTRAVYDGKVFKFNQSKTAHLKKPEMQIPALAPLKRFLDELPRNDSVMLVAMPNGNRFAESTFERQFRVALNAAGLKHLHFHGLRHAAGVALAEAGATEKQIMSWLGHSSSSMAAHYTKAAEQKRLARDAAAKWEASKDQDA